MSRAFSRLQGVLRTFSTATEPVQLAHEAFPATAANGRGPLIFLHGLLGSKQNFRSIAKSLGPRINRDIYTLDLRNHGVSPHAMPATYTAMADDVARFISQKGLKDVVLLGHSLGGKTAMSLALHPQHGQLLSKLIVVDIAPSRGNIGSEFLKYIEGMKRVRSAIEDGSITTRKDADAILKEVEPDMYIRQWLLTNLVKTEERPEMHWRVSIPNLEAGLEEIGKFPYDPEETSFDKPTLFIKGQQSKYINRKNLDLTKGYFPNMQLEEVEGAGHWVHSQKPKEFQQLVTDFCNA